MPELLGMISDENRHSNVLAWLLSSDIYRATHSQGSLGFQIFVEELGLPREYAKAIRYTVGREVRGRDSRIDIEILSASEFIIHIEAKIDACEGEEQLKREWSDLNRKANQCNVFDRNHIHAFYLTRRGDAPPKESNFRPLSWETIANVFEKFGSHAKADSVRWFALHYARALRRFIVLNNDKGDDNGRKDIQRIGSLPVKSLDIRPPS